MRDQINLTDEQIEAAFDGRCSCTVDDLIFTADTIEQFKSARANYAEPGKVVKDEPIRFEADRVQTRRGWPRQDLTVVDFGEVRAALLL